MLLIRPMVVEDLFLRAGIFCELTPGMLQAASQNILTNNKTITAVADGAITPFGSDPKDPGFFRSIRMSPPS
jgi:hypothetical protein